MFPSLEAMTEVGSLCFKTGLRSLHEALRLSDQCDPCRPTSVAVAADSRLFTRHCCESWRRRNNLDGAWHQRADGGCQPLFAVSVRRAREVHDEGRCVADLGTQVVR